MRGPKPIPTLIKLARGNPGKRKLNRREPKPGPLDPTPPVELLDDAAKAEWTRTIAPAIATGQITAADRSMAIAHCDLWAVWRSQLAEAARDPHVKPAGPNDYPMASPVRAMAHRTFTLLIRVDAELGLTPTSRSRVTVPGGVKAADPADDDDRFFKRRA